MMAMTEFCAEFGLEPADVRRALDAERASSRHDAAWYVTALLAVAAWVTALVMIGFAFALLYFVIGIEEPSASFALFGAVLFLAGDSLLGSKEKGVFRAQLGTVLSSAGLIMVVTGVTVETESIWSGVLAAGVLASVVAWRGRSRILQFVASATAVVTVALALLDESRDFIVIAAACLTAIGAVMLLRPPRRDLEPTAMVLLFCAPVFSIFGSNAIGFYAQATEWVWVGKVMLMGLFVYLAATLWRQHTSAVIRRNLAVVAAVALFAALLLPVGGVAALVIMMLAYILGARVLAAAGVLWEIFFISQFYYDLITTLLNKSLIMIAVGVATIAAWAFVSRRVGAQEAS